MERLHQGRLPWILNPSNLAGLAVVSVLLGVGASGIYGALLDWLSDRMSETKANLVLGLSFSVGLVLTVSAGSAIWNWLLRLRQREGLDTAASKMTPFPALIAFVSTGTEPVAEVVIKKQVTEFSSPELRFCWLLYTPGESGSEQNAKDIEDRWARKDGRTIGFARIEVADKDNADKIYQAMLDAFRDAKDNNSLLGNEILVDITGGTKIGTFTMAIAAQRQRASVAFIQSEYVPDKGMDYDNSTPMLFNYNFLSNRRLIRLAWKQVQQDATALKNRSLKQVSRIARRSGKQGE